MTDRTADVWEAATRTIFADSLASKFLETKGQGDFDRVAAYIGESILDLRPVSAPHALLALGYWPDFKSHALRLLDAVKDDIDLREGISVAA